MNVAYVRIVHHWDQDCATSIEVGDEGPAHPDLLDELAARAVFIWRDTCSSAVEDDEA